MNYCFIVNLFFDPLCDDVYHVDLKILKTCTFLVDHIGSDKSRKPALQSLSEVHAEFVPTGRSEGLRIVHGAVGAGAPEIAVNAHSPTYLFGGREVPSEEFYYKYPTSLDVDLLAEVGSQSVDVLKINCEGCLGFQIRMVRCYAMSVASRNLEVRKSVANKHLRAHSRLYRSRLL